MYMSDNLLILALGTGLASSTISSEKTNLKKGSMLFTNQTKLYAKLYYFFSCSLKSNIIFLTEKKSD